MTTYGFYSSDQDLPDDYTDRYRLHLIAYYKGFSVIYENTTDHSLRIREKEGNKWIRLSDSEIKTIHKSITKDFIEEEIHFQLLVKLSKYLSEGNMIVFRNVQGLGKTAYYAEKGYIRLIEEGIKLKFVECSTISSGVFVKTGKVVETEVRPFLSQMIRVALDEANMNDDLPNKLADLPTKEKKLMEKATFDLK